MATQLFLTDNVASTILATDSADLVGGFAGHASAKLDLSRGSGVVGITTNTVAGTTAGIIATATGGGIPYSWISDPVAADVTISGTITANIWASENNMSANVAINVIIEIIRANTTGTRNSNDIVEIVRSTRTTEVAVTTRAVNNFTTGMTSGAYTSQTLNRGDRLRIRVFGDDAGTMGSGFTFSVGYHGTTAAADGDTYVTFTEDITFESAPSGTVLYLTNTQSGLSAAPTLVSDFTGSDENPLSEGGNWANLNTSAQPLARSGNKVSASLNGSCRSYWTPANFGPDLESYITITTLTNTVGIGIRIQGEGGAGTWDGYEVTATSTTTEILRIANAAITTLISVSTTWGSGDKLGVRAVGNTIEVWRQASGSSEWNLVVTTVDTTYTSAGKVAIRCNAVLSFLDDFYAATDSNLFTQQAWTSRGAGVVNYLSATTTGWTVPLLTNEWFTRRLQAFTLTGLAQMNLRALESNAAAQASMRVEIARVDDDGTNATVWSTWCLPGTSAGELTTSEAAYTVNLSGDDLAISDGQRLRIRIYLEDQSVAALVSGHTVTVYYNGTSGGASGDTYVTLPQSVTEYTPPSGGILPGKRRRLDRFTTFR